MVLLCLSRSWEAAKLLALLSGKIDKYEYLTGEEMLPSDQSRIIEQVKFTYSLLSKAFEKQKQTDAITNQNKRLEALTNKDDNPKDIYKEIYNKPIYRTN